MKGSCEFNRFGYEWNRYDKITPLYENQFKQWIAPLTAADFEGVSVLDAGCGTGRNAIWALKYKADRVTAFDVDPRTVAVAAKNLEPYENARILQTSIYDLSDDDQYDVVFSIGVIHHLERPQQAIARLVKATKPGGVVLIWIYAKEGHTFLKQIIQLVRSFTCHIPAGLLHTLVHPVSVPMYLLLKTLPLKHPYVNLLRNAHYWHVHSIIFDQLLPEITHYWTREEALALYHGQPVEPPTIHFCNKGSWTVIAKKRI